MLLAIETMSEEEVDVLMAEAAAKDLEEEVEKVEEEKSKGYVEEALAHMKTEFTSQMSPVTLEIQSGTNYQTIKGRVSLRTR